MIKSLSDSQGEMQRRPLTAAGFDEYLAEHKLAGTRCTACGALYLPPRAICPTCQSSALEWVELAGRGTLAAFTSIFVGPSAMVAQGFDRKNPYVSGVVALEEGPAISARIVGVDANQPEIAWIGTSLVVTFLDKGEGDAKQTTLAFQPADA
jgi:uncharacterized OB-fold protein